MIHGYRSSSKKEFDQASDDLTTTSYPFIAEATADPYASLVTFNYMGFRFDPLCEVVDGYDKEPCTPLGRRYGMLRIFELAPSHRCASKASPTHHGHGDRYDLQYRLLFIILYWGALILSILAFCGSLGSVPNSRYSWIGSIQFSPSSFMMSATSFCAIYFLCMTSTKTSLASREKVIEASFLRNPLFCSDLIRRAPWNSC
ncbi:hypothetical protein Tco_0381327 [Tanacetum coccineum]